MSKLTWKRALAVASAVAAVVVGSGVAVAASRDGSRETAPSRSSFLDDVARHLSVSPERLDAAIKSAALDQVEAARRSGKLSEEQADELEARIRSGRIPPFGSRGPGFGRLGPGPVGPGIDRRDNPLAIAAAYLGLSVEQVREKLVGGQSLREIAKQQGKSVEGLKDALLDGAKRRLDRAVRDGRLTEEQAARIRERIASRLDDVVNASFDGFRADRGFRGGSSEGRLSPGVPSYGAED